MNLFVTILTVVASSGISGLVLAWLLQSWIGERLKQSIAHEYDQKLEALKDELLRNRTVYSSVWQAKKDACLRALNVANAILSNYEYDNVPKKDMKPQFEKIEEVRACLNELACTCEKPDVLEQLKRLMFENVTIDAIVDLRNAVRRELQFTDEEIDKDRKRAFLGKSNCQPPEDSAF